MIQSVWPYLAVMLLAAGLWPAIERRYNWRFFQILPPRACWWRGWCRPCYSC